MTSDIVQMLNDLRDIDDPTDLNNDIDSIIKYYNDHSTPQVIEDRKEINLGDKITVKLHEKMVSVVERVNSKWKLFALITLTIGSMWQSWVWATNITKWFIGV